ncbi:MAG: alpha/beta fold hydrolase [Actinobacteria bacterium]|nr:alpha/beta fold hydrolase [Actinomycetota bacterium]
MSTFTLAAGRTIEFLDNAVESDRAIIFHHGTPGSSRTWQPWIAHFADEGIRVIAASRAGYGQSQRAPGRRVVDISDDITQMCDSFDISRFVSVGWSGGGPHALATTLDPRCKGVVTLAGVGQFNQPDLDFLAGMGQENIDEFGVALQGEAALRDWMNANAAAMARVTGEEIRAAFGGLIGTADKAVLDGPFAAEMAAAMRWGLAQGFDGWIDDDLAFVRDWGFDLADISVPVVIWQGNDDFMVPHAHSQWLEQAIPSSELRLTPGEGHISLTVKGQNEIVIQLKLMLS